jgi:integrase
MSAAIDFAPYARYFNVSEFKDINKALILQPIWLHEDTPFESNVWKVKDNNGSYLTFSFNVLISPNLSLIDVPDLLRTVKLSVFLYRQSNVGSGKAGCSAITMMKFLSVVCLTIRSLRRLNINYFRSINGEVVKLMVDEMSVGEANNTTVTLSLSRVLESIKTSAKDYTKKDGSLDVSKIASLVGVPARVLTTSRSLTLSLLESFKVGNGFYIKPETLKSMASREAANAELGQDFLRKKMDMIKAFFRILTFFPSIFPKEYVCESNAINSLLPDSVKWSKKHATKKHKRTGDIPIKDFLLIMDRAIRWVVDYSSDLIKLRAEAADQFEKFVQANPQSGEHYAAKKMRQWLYSKLKDFEGLPGAPYPIAGYKVDYNSSSSKFTDEEIKRVRESKGKTIDEIELETGISRASIFRIREQPLSSEMNGISLNKAVHHFLPIACILVIYAFTARRKSEIQTLRAGCCWDTKDGPIIRMYSAKYYQEYQDFPTTRLVKKAVEILELITEPLRTKTGDNSILNIPSLSSREKSDLIGGKYINEFAKFIGLANESVSSWEFSEHQFRRLFAIMYFYRYEKGDLATLSWHLRHTDFNTTMVYLTDEDFQLVMREVSIQFAKDVAREPSEYKGLMKDELIALVDSIDAQPPKRVDKLLKDAGVNSGFALSIVQDGMCFGMTPALFERSKCLMNGSLQLSSASLGSCFGCKNLLGCKSTLSAEAIDEIIDPFDSPMLKAAEEFINDHQ